MGLRITTLSRYEPFLFFLFRLAKKQPAARHEIRPGKIDSLGLGRRFSEAAAPESFLVCSKARTSRREPLKFGASGDARVIAISSRKDWEI
jgi:hypothetical protein